MDNLAQVGDPPEQGTNPPDTEREVTPPVVAPPPARPEPPPLAFYRRGTHLIKKRPGHGVRKGPRTLPPTPAEEEQVARLAADEGDRARRFPYLLHELLDMGHPEDRIDHLLGQPQALLNVHLGDPRRGQPSHLFLFRRSRR